MDFLRFLKFDTDTKIIDFSNVLYAQEESTVEVTGMDISTVADVAVWNGEKWIAVISDSKVLPAKKLQKISEFSAESFAKAEGILPEYKKLNALFDIYDETTKLSYKNTITAFRTEFYRLKALVEACNSVNEIEAINSNFPTGLVE